LEKQTNYVQDFKTYITTLPDYDSSKAFSRRPLSVIRKADLEYRGRQVSRSA